MEAIFGGIARIALLLQYFQGMLRETCKENTKSTCFSQDDSHAITFKPCLPLLAKQQKIIYNQAHKQLNGKPLGLRFNNDGKHYTPSFINVNQKKIIAGMESQLRQIFDRKVVEERTRKSHLYVPRPSSQFCGVCRESFEDYLEHVSHPVHRNNLSNSDFDVLIRQMTKTMPRVLSKTSKGEGPRKRHKAQLEIQKALKQPQIQKDLIFQYGSESIWN